MKEHPRVKLLREQIERRTKMVETYQSLVEYWSGSRYIGGSQTAEYVKSCLDRCKLALNIHEGQLQVYKIELASIS